MKYARKFSDEKIGLATGKLQICTKVAQTIRSTYRIFERAPPAA
jgi:hypothetical protein